MSNVATDNLSAWRAARSGGTSQIRPARVDVPTPAARELLSDPHWADKVRRALAQSERGEVRSLRQHRDSLA